MRRLMCFYKSSLVPGFLVILPISAIIWIIAVLISGLKKVPYLIPKWASPVNIFEIEKFAAAKAVNIASTILVIVLFFTVVALIGYASKKLVGKKILSIISAIIEHIPVLSTVYSALVQLGQTFARDGHDNFRGVKLIEYPRRGIYSFAFVTNETVIGGKRHFTVFVPTTPNPTSGFFIIVPEEDAIDSQFTVEDAFKAILSMGTVTPKNKMQNLENTEKQSGS